MNQYGTFEATHKAFYGLLSNEIFDTVLFMRFVAEDML